MRVKFRTFTLRVPLSRTFVARVGQTHTEPGVYELFLIQKKSMKVPDYRKKVQHSDIMTENKEPEKVEKMVVFTHQVLEESQL